MKVAAAKESVMKERLDSSDDDLLVSNSTNPGYLLYDNLSLRNSDDISLKDIFSLKDVCCVNAEQILLNKHTIITAAMKSDSILNLQSNLISATLQCNTQSAKGL